MFTAQDQPHLEGDQRHRDGGLDPDLTTRYQRAEEVLRDLESAQDALRIP